MKYYLKNLTALLSIMIASTSILNADIVDFEKLSQKHKGKSLTISESWQSIKKGEDMTIVDGGLSLVKDEKSAGESIKYTKAYSQKDFPLTVSVDFSYESVKEVRGTNIFSIGFTNGDSELSGVFYRYGWGDYMFIGYNVVNKGAFIETDKIGLKWNRSLGKSDKVRMSFTIDKGQKNDTFDIYVGFENITKGKEHKWGFGEKGLKFSKGDVDKLYGFMRAERSNLHAGIKNCILSKFEIGKKQPNKVDVYIPDGVDFGSFILPMKPVKPLVTDGVWGKALLPRDTSNGLESPKPIPDYCYWDGSIVKDDNGKYHMYASRWDTKYPHHIGWTEMSKATHAISAGGVEGPYIDQGLVYPQWNEGKGHNVVGLKTFDGKYAVTTSEITQGEIFLSDNPNGPFKLLGEIQVDLNGFNPGLVRYNGGTGHMSNVQITKRHDGRYMIVPRQACILISEKNIIGPYKIMTERIFNNFKGVPQRCMEDPTIWYSGGMYHMLVNEWTMDTTYHFSSIDGINDWKYRGIAFKKHTGMFRYEDGTVNEWEVVQRPTVYVENGHVTHILFSVIDTGKGGDAANDAHGSKIIVVPFDGKAFDKAMQNLVEKEAKSSK